VGLNGDIGIPIQKYYSLSKLALISEGYMKPCSNLVDVICFG